MSTSVESFQRVRSTPVRDGIDRFLRTRVLASLAPLQGGQLHLHDAFGDLLIGDVAEPLAVTATIVSAIAGSAASAGQLRLAGLEDIGPSYALTLQHWRQRFLARLDDVRAQGFDDRFLRIWEFYLCYCEGGFIEGAISDAQMLLAKPGQRGVRSQSVI